MYNPYALYVNCDGAMNYGKGNIGGVGFVFTFPDSVGMEPMEFPGDSYRGANIEQLELEALIQAMKKSIEVYNTYSEKLKNVAEIVFITDRYGLRDEDKTNPYKIKEWRRNGWKNHEGKPIKNHKLLDELDKTRNKLRSTSFLKVRIEWRRRKENKQADKLAKAGKLSGNPNFKLQKRGEKIGKRKFSGPEMRYSAIKSGDEFHVNVFRKDPVQDQWEVWVEICTGEQKGNKFKIYADNLLADELKRGNEFVVRIKNAHQHHTTIYPELIKP